MRVCVSRWTAVLLVVGFILGAAAQPRARAAGEEAIKQIRGFSLQLNDALPEAVPRYIKAVDDMAAMGCTSINFVVAGRQKDVRAETMALVYANLPSIPDIQKILRHAKAKGIYTILMPVVLLDNAESKEWRGVIDPPNWDDWFFSYRTYMKIWADVARTTKVDLFCVGSELLSTEPLRSQWLTTIAEIKSSYKGKLTYSANWDHYTAPKFWDQLDYIGMNNYNELAKKHGASLAELNKNWKPIKDKILAFAKEQKKPFLFMEVGWHNLDNTIAEPWNYVATGEIDLEEQRRAFESFVQTWKDVGTDKYMGALVWEWVPELDGAKTHGAYSLQGTPALEVVKKWMAGK